MLLPEKLLDAGGSSSSFQLSLLQPKTNKLLKPVTIDSRISMNLTCITGVYFAKREGRGERERKWNNKKCNRRRSRVITGKIGEIQTDIVGIFASHLQVVALNCIKHVQWVSFKSIAYKKFYHAVSSP